MDGVLTKTRRNITMMLITAAIKKALESTPIYTHDDKPPADVPVIVKFFDPMGRYTYYVTECEVVDEGNRPEYRFYGFCVSPLGKDCDELGYAMFNEIVDAFKGRVLPLERDRHFEGSLLDAYEANGFTRYK